MINIKNSSYKKIDTSLCLILNFNVGKVRPSFINLKEFGQISSCSIVVICKYYCFSLSDFVGNRKSIERFTRKIGVRII